MRIHHALQPRTPEQSAYSTGRRDGKRFLKLYRSYLHGSLAGAREPVYEGTVVEDADDWLGDGLSVLSPGEVSTIVLAGVSAQTTWEIIEKAPWVSAPGG